MDKAELLTVEEGYSVVKCKNCNFVFIDADFSTRELENFYTREYFTEAVDYFNEQERTYMAGRYLDEVKKIKKKGKLLEIGCASGFLLKLAQKQGFDSYGVEISGDASKFAREKLGLKVKNSTLENARFKPRSSDVVILINVLEHLTNPLETLREVNRILKDDGIVMVCVPNLDSANMRLRYFFHLLKYKNGSKFSKLHLSYFTPETLTEMCKSSGFKVISLKTRFLTHYLYKLSKLMRLDQKMVKKIKPGSLDVQVQKSLMNQIWSLINKLDRTRYGIDIQVILNKKQTII